MPIDSKSNASVESSTQPLLDCAQVNRGGPEEFRWNSRPCHGGPGRTLKAVIDFSASELIVFDERIKEEANQLRALFRKAMQHGIEPVEALGGFPHVDDFELVGTMSDAAKRQSDGQYPVHSKANRKLSMPMPSTSEGADKQDGCYASSAANLPYPSSSELPLPNSSLPPLPPGVINTEQWGRSIINFGKYKGKNISYIELLSSTSEDMRGYVKWCSSRQSTAGGELKDLTSFMRRHEMENSHSALVRGEMIPGTSARRSFKSP
eukprot:g33625.t1